MTVKLTAQTSVLLLALLSGSALYTPVNAETLLERGTYLMRSIVACGNCHTPKGPTGELTNMELAGMANLEVNPGFTAHAANITGDMKTGIGAWSDDEIITAIREGKRPDGSIIGPPMPIGLYRGLSDRDANAIVAYLRSIPAVSNPVPDSDYKIPLPPSYGPPVGSVPEVSRDDKVAYGAYLAGPAGHCIECHSPMGPTGPDIRNNLGAGGFEFHGPWGVSVSANITPTGLSKWSDSELEQMIRTGKRPDGSPMMPPMGYAYYANISDSDMAAIIAYLRSLPPK